jgi:hypothetical protein
VVVAVSTADGVTRVEGTAPTDLQPGTLLRFHDQAAPGRMKGLAVVLSSSEGRFTARLTGLTDKTRPLATGDQAVPGDLDAPTPPPRSPDALRAAELARRLASREAESARSERAFADLHARATAPPPPAVRRTGLGEELARIEAERAYFDLCARVLGLNASDPDVVALQLQIRRALEARADLAQPAKEGAHGH